MIIQLNKSLKAFYEWLQADPERTKDLPLRPSFLEKRFGQMVSPWRDRWVVNDEGKMSDEVFAALVILTIFADHADFTTSEQVNLTSNFPLYKNTFLYRKDEWFFTLSSNDARVQHIIAPLCADALNERNKNIAFEWKNGYGQQMFFLLHFVKNSVEMCFLTPSIIQYDPTKDRVVYGNNYSIKKKLEKFWKTCYSLKNEIHGNEEGESIEVQRLKLALEFQENLFDTAKHFSVLENGLPSFVEALEEGAVDVASLNKMRTHIETCLDAMKDLHEYRAFFGQTAEETKANFEAALLGEPKPKKEKKRKKSGEE